VNILDTDALSNLQKIDAVETVRDNRARYAEAEARARANRPPRPPWFDVFQGAMAFASDGAD
jgi:hypothetical protein